MFHIRPREVDLPPVYGIIYQFDAVLVVLNLVQRVILFDLNA